MPTNPHQENARILFLQEHLEKRHVQLKRYDTIFFSEEEVEPSILWSTSPLLVACASFRLYTVTGKPTGVMQYRPLLNKNKRNDEHGRYHLHATRGNLGFWGLESLSYRNDVLFICEGIFDAVRVHNLNLPCLAVFSNDPKHLGNQLALLGRKIVAVCDNDSAGSRLQKFGDDIIICPYEGSDLGDLSDKDVEQLFQSWSVSL